MREFGNTNFQVSIIPHTMQETNLKDKKSGDIVNLECDIVRKIYREICK